jgi:hypothetical protein
VERHEKPDAERGNAQHEIRDLKEAAASLLHVAEIHEARISRLEGEEGDEATQ